MKKITRMLIILLCSLVAAGTAGLFAQGTADEPWVVYEGGNGPGEGKHIVFVSGDEEYRSEEALPALAKILTYRHGFKSTVLFAINPETGGIDPNYQQNIPGLENLKDADLMVMLTRFRALPEDQMEHILAYVNAGKPIIGMRTSTHAFQYEEDSPYHKYSSDSEVEGWEGGFGRQVLGETWINHHGEHGSESTQGVVNGLVQDHPILTDVEDVWGPTDVYGIEDITGDERVLLFGQSLEGMKPGSPANFSKSVMPVAWVKNYTASSGKTLRVFNTTMGASEDLQNEGMRRLLVNAAYWGVGLEDQIPRMSDVELVGEYNPTSFGFDEFQKGLTISDFEADPETVKRVLEEETSEPTASTTVGTWDYMIDSPEGVIEDTFTINESGDGFGGTFQFQGNGDPVKNVAYRNSFLVFDTSGEYGPMQIEVKVNKDSFEGVAKLVNYKVSIPIEGSRKGN